MVLLSPFVLASSVNAQAEIEPKKMVMLQYEPWQTLNNNVNMSQHYYDMPLMKASGKRIEDLRREMLLAGSYGVNAFCLTTSPPANWAYEYHFGTMLQAVEGTPLKVVFNFSPARDSKKPLEDDGNLDLYVTGIKRIYERWGKHPNWLHINGRPAFATFWGGKVPPEFYDLLRQRLEKAGLDLSIIGDPEYLHDKPVSIEGLNRYKNKFDLIYSFSELGRDGKQSPLTAFQTLAQGAPDVARSKAWMAPLSPGYYGGWISGRNDYYVPFRNLDQFLECGEAAVKTNPDWLFLCTWNDKDETYLQPTIYQWESMMDISAYYIERWRTGQVPVSKPRFYCAYPREQLIGSVQRLEMVALPGRNNSLASVRGELRTPEGKKLADLPERTLSGDIVKRTDWAIDTAQFAAHPVIVPVVKLKGSSQEYKLPAFVLRSGWVENQAIIRAPLDRMGTEKSQLTVQLPNQHLLEAKVSYTGTEPLKSATLFRNDRRLMSFDTTNGREPRTQLILSLRKAGTLRLNVTDGKILRVMRGEESVQNVQWNNQELNATQGPGILTAIELGNLKPETIFSFSEGGKTPINYSLVELLNAEDGLSFGESGKVNIAKFDGLSDVEPELNGQQNSSTLELSAYFERHRSTDSYFVRLETVSGKCTETPWVFPCLKNTPTLVESSVIHSPLSLDIRSLTNYFNPPKLSTTTIKRIKVHPAILQSSEWNFNTAANPGLDKQSRNQLTLGRGEGFLTVDTKRVPQWLESGGANGNGCLQFDGIDDRAQLPVQQEPKGTFRIGFDIFPEGQPQQEQCILGSAAPQDSGDSSNGILITRLPDGRIRAGRRNLQMLTSPTPLGKERWSRVEVIFSGDRLTLEVDGKRVATAVCSPDFKRFGNSRLYLGGPSSPLQGRLDNFLIQGFA